MVLCTLYKPAISIISRFVVSCQVDVCGGLCDLPIAGLIHNGPA